MSTKTPLAFQPAPRPQPRVSPEDTKRLQEATQDLGFGRPTGSPTAFTSEDANALPKPPEPVSKIKPSKALQGPAETPNTAVEGGIPFKDAALKIAVPDDLWNELRLQALKRRVTVKFLVLEALAEKGYTVDLAAIPEDGRRIR